MTVKGKTVYLSLSSSEIGAIVDVPGCDDIVDVITLFSEQKYVAVYGHRSNYRYYLNSSQVVYITEATNSAPSDKTDVPVDVN